MSTGIFPLVPQQVRAKRGPQKWNGLPWGTMIALTMMLAPLAAHPVQVSGTDPAFRAKNGIRTAEEKQSHTQAKDIRRCPFWL